VRTIATLIVLVGGSTLAGATTRSRREARQASPKSWHWANAI